MNVASRNMHFCPVLYIFCSYILLYKYFHVLGYLYDALQNMFLLDIPILSAKYVLKIYLFLRTKSHKQIFAEITRQGVP